MEYPKIETLYERDLDTFGVTDKLRKPVLGTISLWQVTEKIDGTNIRVILSASGELSFGGRTDNAQLHAGLFQCLARSFSAERLKDVFWQNCEPCNVVLYGEGYGAGIQKGGNYRPDPAFRLFDVLVVGKWWLDWENTCDVASNLNIKTVPYLGDWWLAEIRDKVKAGIPSQVAREESRKETLAEGIVARTLEPLFDKRGHRLIIKLKTKDFKG